MTEFIITSWCTTWSTTRTSVKFSHDWLNNLFKSLLLFLIFFSFCRLVFFEPIESFLNSGRNSFLIFGIKFSTSSLFIIKLVLDVVSKSFECITTINTTFSFLIFFSIFFTVILKKWEKVK